MSETSLFPHLIDVFIPKIDTTDGEDGDVILAEHVNLIQDAITAIETTLGTNPEGGEANVAQRLGFLSQSKALSLSRLTLYKGNPKLVNGAASVSEAARYFNYFSIVMIDGVDPFGNVMLDTRDVIDACKPLGSTYFYGTIDAGVSTSNLPLSDIGNICDRWKDIGADGVYFENFGYDRSTSRARQNSIVELAQSKGLRVLVSANNIDDVFDTVNPSGMNPGGVETVLTSGDGYIELGYATEGQYYQNAAELQGVSIKMLLYRSAYGVSMYGLGYISGSDSTEKAKKYYYGQAAAMVFSLNGFHVIDDTLPINTVWVYNTFPILGNYYDASPVLHSASNSISRFSNIGNVSVDTANHTYNFSNIKIPAKFIDFDADDSSINAARLTGTLAAGVNIQAISRINLENGTINSNRISWDGTSIINGINLAAGGEVKISKDAIADLNNIDIEAQVIKALGTALDEKLQSGTLDADFDRLTSSVISSVNAYFTKIKAAGGTFNGIDAGIMNVGYLNAGIIDTNTITSDKLSIHGNSGLNKWTGTIVSKVTPGVVAALNDTYVRGLDVYRKLELADNMPINTSDIIGGSLHDYVVMWETNVYCTEVFTWTTSFTANSNTVLYINTGIAASCTPNGTVVYSATLQPGWNSIRVYQDHNSEVSCQFDIGIEFSSYSLQTEKNPTEPTPISRVDAYSSRTTQIIGDMLKTGTVEADKLVAKSITADQIASRSITAAEITAGSITANEIDVQNVNAAIVNAGLITAMEAYIQHLTATEGDFEKVLADILTSKFINANNVSISSEAKGINGDTGYLVINNGGLDVSQNPKAKIAIPTDVMTQMSARVFRTSNKPLCDDPAPSFTLRDKTTLALTPLNRDDFALIYEYGQITVDEDINISNADIVAAYSYFDEYYPLATRVVRVNRDGIMISSNGGRPGTWQTKLDGNRLYVVEADITEASITNAHIKDGTIQSAKIGDAQITNAHIFNVSADKLTAGTIDASIITVINVDASNINTGTLIASGMMAIQGGNVQINTTGLQVSGGAGITVTTTDNKVITLNHNGLISENFSIGADGNVSITGNIEATTGTIANWVIGTNTIKDSNNKIILDSSVPNINIDGGKVILGLYDGINYGIKAVAGKIGGLDITVDGLRSALLYDINPTSINVTGSEAVTINTGTMVIRDTEAIHVTVGMLDQDVYGMNVDLTAPGSYIQLDQNGLRSYDGTRYTFQILDDGDISIIGDINATSGTFAGITVNGSITLAEGGSIVAGLNSLSNTGIIIRTGDINIGNGKFIVGTNGVLIAKEADIGGIIKATGGWFGTAEDHISITGTGIQAGSVVIDHTGLAVGASVIINDLGITANAGSIAGWILSVNELYNGNIHIDRSNNAIWIGSSLITANIKLNNDGSAKLGKITVGTDGSVLSTNFSIDASGNVVITGTVNATAGFFGNGTNGVGVTSTGIQINGTGEIKNANTKIVNKTLTIYSGASYTTPEVILGEYSVGNYGIKAGTTILDKNGLTMSQGSISLGTSFSVTNVGLVTATAGKIGNWTIGTNTLTSGNIIIDATTNAQKIAIGTNIVLNNNGSATIGKFNIATSGAINAGSNFIIDESGNLTIIGNITANDGTFNGTVQAVSGWFGTLTNHILVSGNGLVAGDVVLDDEGLKVGASVIINGSGISAIAGNIGGWTINAGSLTSANITLDGMGNKITVGTHITIDGATGKLTADDVDLTGKITSTEGNISGWDISSTTLANGTNIILDSANYKVSFNSDAAIIGQYAAGKYGMKVSNFTINGTDSQMYVGANYAASNFKIDLTTGNATLANTTISGTITATLGAIGGWAIANTTITGGTVTLDSTGIMKVTKTGDATKYVQIDGTGLNVVGGLLNIVTGISGTNNVTIDSNGIKAGGDTLYAKLDSSGLTIAGGAINITTAVNGAKKLEIKSTGIIAIKDASNRVELDGDGVRCIKGGNTLGSAITPDGIVGQLLTEQSIVGTKFDKVAPAVPTGANVVQVIEQTATSEFINLDITWNAITDTDNDLAGYKIYLKEGTGLYYPMGAVNNNALRYIIRNVKGNTNYIVVVSSFDLTGNESAKSTDFPIHTTNDTIAPAKVTGLGTVDGPKMFYIRWNSVIYNWNSQTGTVNISSPCTDLDHYEVQRKVEFTGSTVEDWNTINKTYSTGIIDKDVAYSYDYSYRVRPVDLSGNHPETTGIDEWATIAAGKPSKIGAADIVAGSITADVLNVGSMVKSIDPQKTMLWHFDGVTTSTQDARPILLQGGSWSSGKFGDGLSLEEATVNLVSEATLGNAGFKNGTASWTINGAIYQASGGVGGTNDGYVGVTETNTASVTLDTIIGDKYAVSVFTRSAIFTEPTFLIITANGAEIIDTSVFSEWKRVIYIYTATAISTTFVFKSGDGYTACVDNVQIEHRGFVTTFTESHSLETGIRPEGIVKYASDRLNPEKGILSYWFRPNRSGESPNTSGQILWMWGEESVDNSKGLFALKITNDNRPRLTIAGNGWSHTITHEASVDAMSWNELTIRWVFDNSIAAEDRYAEIFLNGTESMDKIDLAALQSPPMTVSTFTLGNHNDGGYSCNGTFDEFKIDIDCVMDQQEKEEIISWYKSGSTFYDASSQIDADSQGISAANAKVTINNEGITVRDGLMKVVSDDGVTLIGGGRININGMNVGVVQGENEVLNGNFSALANIYGKGDMYLTTDGIMDFGAKYWRSRRSSAFTPAVTSLCSAYNGYETSKFLDYSLIRSTLFNTYNATYRTNEAAIYTIENAILPGMYANGIASVSTGFATQGTNTVTVQTLLVLPGMMAYIGSGSNRESLLVAGVNPISNTITFNTNFTMTHNPGVYIVEKTIFDDMLEDELSFQINKVTDDKYDEWDKFGISSAVYNDINGDMVIKGLRVSPEGVLQRIPYDVNRWTGAFNIDVDPITLLPKVYEATEVDGMFGHTIYEVWPKETKFGKTGYAKLGVNTLNADLSVDTSEQIVSVEQNLVNLITYTDGLLPKDTNWKQHVFTFYAKWDEKPIGSQGKLEFQVDEMVPNYTVDEDNIATVVPSFGIVTPDNLVTVHDMLIANTDFATAGYQLALGHATWPEGHVDHKKYTLNSIRYASILPALKVRYIRDWVNGNSVDTSNNWIEFWAYNTLAQPIISAAVTGSATVTNVANATDGNPVTYATIATTGAQWLQLDLGNIQTVGAIVVLHGPGMTYHGTRTQVSEDGVKWYDVYNSIYQGEYAETTGLIIGGAVGMTPNPIIVEEVFTALGDTAEGKTHVIVKNDGVANGLDHAKYLSTTEIGDVITIAFQSEFVSTGLMHLLKNDKVGMCTVFLNNEYYADIDTSFPVPMIDDLPYDGITAGAHTATLVATDNPGWQTSPGEIPKFMFAGVDFYDYHLIDSTYSTVAEYDEVDPTAWNKVIIKPNTTNDKSTGTPKITASKVPVKYRVKAKLTKVNGDPFPCSVLITGIQAELGENESFSRTNYGVGGMPTYMLQPFISGVGDSGITSAHLQEYHPRFVLETGVQERHVADHQITTRKLAISAVTSDIIATGNVTFDKLSKIPKQKLDMNVSIDEYEYPIVLTINSNPKVRYIPCDISEGSEDIYINGQLQFVDDDYIIEQVVAAQHIADMNVAAAGSTSTTLKLSTSASAVDDTYNATTVIITGGTGAGQSRIISDYDGVTKTATVPTWDITPDATSQYRIIDDEQYAYKITFLRDIVVNDKIWGTYWKPIVA